MLLKPLLPNQEQTRVTWGQLYGGSISLALSEAATQSNAPLLVIVPSAELADRIEADLKFYLQASGLPVWHFPDWETLPYDVFSPHQDIVSERLATLYHLPDIKNGVVVVAAATLMQRLPPRAWLDGGTLLMDVGERVNIDELRRRMESGGYRCVSQVMEHGEFAIRGSLIDIFPMGASLPFRVDLFDDEIESIRSFDPETQLSKEKLSKIRMLPAREFPLHDEAIRGFRQRYRARFEGDPKKS
ncbi:MAG: transcription-repair coupling factor, partial [Gammaproteobacteria bacterium]|nr:transcription-repair coupling factor [Gammaproteobacteria bacterium]